RKAGTRSRSHPGENGKRRAQFAAHSGRSGHGPRRLAEHAASVFVGRLGDLVGRSIAWRMRRRRFELAVIDPCVLDVSIAGRDQAATFTTSLPGSRGVFGARPPSDMVIAHLRG